MSGIGLYAKDLQVENLGILQVILLKIIYTKEQKMFDIFCKLPEFRVLLQSLEAGGYIKIMNDPPELSDIILRSSADKIIEEFSDNVTAVLEYLNSQIAGESKRGFSIKSEANRKFINGRLNEGYTVEDLKGVIDLKVKEWKGTDYEMYLRPETLFNPTKFQNYYVQSHKKSSKVPINDML